MINLIDVAVVVKWKGLSLLDPMIKVEEEIIVKQLSLSLLFCKFFLYPMVPCLKFKFGGRRFGGTRN